MIWHASILAAMTVVWFKAMMWLNMKSGLADLSSLSLVIVTFAAIFRAMRSPSQVLLDDRGVTVLQGRHQTFIPWEGFSDVTSYSEPATLRLGEWQAWKRLYIYASVAGKDVSLDLSSIMGAGLPVDLIKAAMEAMILESRGINPNEIARRFGFLASALLGTGDTEGAVRSLRRGLRWNPKDPQLRYNLAVVLQSKKELEAAAAEYREALRLEPAADAYNNLGTVLEALGDREAALESFQRAYELNPTHPVARGNYERLSSEIKDS